jgi:hypothetical protein
MTRRLICVVEFNVFYIEDGQVSLFLSPEIEIKINHI